jgi:hypothetical protein
VCASRLVLQCWCSSGADHGCCIVFQQVGDLFGGLEGGFFRQVYQSVQASATAYASGVWLLAGVGSTLVFEGLFLAFVKGSVHGVSQPTVAAQGWQIVLCHCGLVWAQCIRLYCSLRLL